MFDDDVKALEEIIPGDVFARLTAEELRDAEEARKNLFPFLAKMRGGTVNEGVLFAAMNDPMKYSVVSFGAVSEEMLCRLVAFDRSRLDEFHELYHRGRVEEVMWDQAVSTVSAALGNPNLSEPVAVGFLEYLVETNPYEDYDSAALLNLVGYGLFDKWTPGQFGVPALNALVSVMEKYGATDWVGKLRRLLRKAEKRSSATV